MEESRNFGLKTPSSRRPAARSEYRRARGTDLSDDELRVRRSGIGGGCFNLQENGNTYSRIMNPTVAVFEERMANLEVDAGPSRLRAGSRHRRPPLFTLLSPGDHVVSSSALDRRDRQSAQTSPAEDVRGIDVGRSRRSRRMEAGRQGQYESVLRRDDRVSGGNVLDIEAVASVAHAHGLPLVVDNTFATPFLCRPIEWGADIILHSATKFIGGHARRWRRGDRLGAVQLVERALSSGRTALARLSRAQFHETFGTYGYPMTLAPRPCATSAPG